MKILRRITFILFILASALFLFFSWREARTADSSYPVLSLPSPSLALSIHATEADLLDGVTAHDKKDGDLTDRVLVESISPFIQDQTCKVTYAVVDSDNHVTKATRTLQYTDYTPPRFTLSRPLVFTMEQDINVRELVGATDCLDGDISDQITVVATDYDSSVEGVFTLSVQVTNSYGDMIHHAFPLYVQRTTGSTPHIELSEALIYVPVGTALNFESYISSINNAAPEVFRHSISTDYDPNTPGTYEVHYYAFSPDGSEGHTVLTVIVEE